MPVAAVRGKHVIDASAVLAALLPGERAAAAARDALAACARGTAALLAPELLPYEVAQALLKAGRDPAVRLPAAVAAAMAEDLEQIGIVLTRLTASSVLETAHEYGFSGYDAAYVALARRERASLITADRRLARLVRSKGLDPAVTLYPDDA